MVCGGLWWSVVICGGLWYLDSPPDRKLDGRTVQLLYASKSSFGGIKKTLNTCMIYSCVYETCSTLVYIGKM